MAEVPHAGQDHGDTVLVRRSDDLFVAHAAAWLDDGDRARRYDHIDAVATRKEGGPGDHRPLP